MGFKGGGGVRALPIIDQPSPPPPFFVLVITYHHTNIAKFWHKISSQELAKIFLPLEQRQGRKIKDFRVFFRAKKNKNYYFLYFIYTLDALKCYKTKYIKLVKNMLTLRQNYFGTAVWGTLGPVFKHACDMCFRKQVMGKWFAVYLYIK